MQILRFGKYRGWPVDDVPSAYLSWLWSNVPLQEPLLVEVRRSLFPEVLEVVAPERDKVRRVYYELSKRWHPDKGGNLQAMQAVNEFYERLTD